MKKFIALLMACMMIMSLCASASAASLNTNIGPKATQKNSSPETKSSDGEPTMNVTNFGTSSVGYFNCRIRRSSDSAAATPNYQFKSTGSKKMYYLSGMGGKTAYFVRVQIGDNETNTYNVALSWNP